MTPEPRDAVVVATSPRSSTAALQEHIERIVEDLLASFPDPVRLSSEERRGIVARYTAVLEGNFIYWMTAAYLSVTSAGAQAIIQDNLLEEVRDNHPGMLRRFAMAAGAVPTDFDALAVHRALHHVRQFVARLADVKLILMMAFFEGFIMRFMPYLAELAAQLGSAEQEYTDVHGVCDVAHTQGLFRALEMELALRERPSTAQMLEGVEILRTLIQTIVHPTGAGQMQP